jgi:hypothetical protein
LQLRDGPRNPTDKESNPVNNKLTVLAADDELTIVLVEAEPADMPNSIVIHWPPAPTVSDPGAFPEVASAVVKLFAGASTQLASIKARRRL